MTKIATEILISGGRGIMPLMLTRRKVACSALCLLTAYDVAAQLRGSVERYAPTLSMIGDKTGIKRKAYKRQRCVHSLPWSRT